MVNLEVEQVEMKRTDGDFADALVSHPGTLLFRPLRSLLPTYSTSLCLGDDPSAAPAARSSPIVL